MYPFRATKLGRVDGIAVDGQAQWRAGAHTYGGRADMILPFLRDSSNTMDLGLVGAAPFGLSSPEGRHGDGNRMALGSDSVLVASECPWCGSRLPGDVNTNMTTRSVGLWDRGVGEEDDAETRATAGDTSAMENESRPYLRHTPENADTSRGKSCSWCGFVLPVLELRRAYKTHRADSNRVWNDVRAAGDRWRSQFYADCSKDIVVETASDDGLMLGAFRCACLRGREEWAKMRRRHRQDERRILTNADLDAAETQQVRARCTSGRARTGSMMPARQKLEVRLELGANHARERRSLAAAQLRVHGAGSDWTSFDQDHYNGMSAVRHALHGSTISTNDGKADSNDKSVVTNDMKDGPICRRDTAARAIQRSWRLVCVRIPISLDGSLSHGADTEAVDQPKEEAVTKVQSTFRGFHVRRALQVWLHRTRST